MNTFLQLSKVEAQKDGTCIVRGTATAEKPDLTNEIFDWVTGRPAVEKWRDDALLRSGGKSLGNIRAMHGKNIAAAGIAKVISFDELKKTIELESHITDLDDARKCITGTYTGYSIGGGYVDRWPDPVIKGAMRYTPTLTEISLVDSPCLESALFDYVKVDGTTELRKFAVPVIQASSTLSGEQMDHLAKAVGALTTAKQAKAAAAEALVKQLAMRKSMYDVGTLAQIMSQISSMEDCLTWESDYKEGDPSPIPAQLRTALIALKQIFLDLATEEVNALVGEAPAAAKTAAAEIHKEVASMVTELQKAIAMAGASTDPEMKKMEAHLTEIGKHVDKIKKAHEEMAPHIDALTGNGSGDSTDDSEKAEKLAAATALAKAKGDLNKDNDTRFASIEESLRKSNEVLGLIANRLVPTPVAAVQVAKVADIPGAPAATVVTDPLEAIKLAHAAGPTLHVAGR